MIERRILTTGLAILLLGAAEIRTQNWPSFRGENASGIAEGYPLPTTWDVDSSENVRWKSPLPGTGYSSPIVWGDRIFLTTAIDEANPSVGAESGNGEKSGTLDWQLLAIAKASGKILWQRSAVREVPRLEHHSKASYSNPSPATDGKHLVAILGGSTLFAYDFAGHLLWKQDLGLLDQGHASKPESQWGDGSSPIIYRDRVYVQVDRRGDSFVAAYAVATGERLWIAGRDELPAWSTPTIYESPQGSELVVNGARWIRGYDVANGRELWSFFRDLQVIVPTPVVAGGLIYVCGGYPRGQPIYAIRPGARGEIALADGEDSGRFVAFRTKRGGPYVPTPIVYRERLYSVSDNGVLSIFDANTGQRLSRRRVGGEFSASPVAGAGKLYLTSEDGKVYVFAAGGDHRLRATNEMGEGCMATPAISEEVLYIRTLHHLYAIADDGGRTSP